MESRMEAYLNAAISGNTENLPKPISRIDFLLYALVETISESGASIEEVEKIVSEKVAEIVASAPEDFNTLKEISDWIYSHEDSAAAMNTAIQKNVSSIENLTTVMNNNFAAIKTDIALNRTTLGTRCKNLHDTLSVNWYQPSETSVASDGTVTATMTSDPRSFTYANSEHYITLEAGNYIITANTLEFVAGSSALIRGCNSDNQSLFSLSISSAGLHKAAFSLSEKTTIGIMYKLYSQTCTIMIRDADIIDDTYEPYRPSLQEQISALISRIAALEV